MSSALEAVILPSNVLLPALVLYEPLAVRFETVTGIKTCSHHLQHRRLFVQLP